MLSSEHHALIGQIRGGSPRQRATQLVDAVLARKDGSSFPAVIAAAPVDHENGDVTVVIVNDLSETRQALHRLEASLDEREILLREIHHRVKNNLQLVSSLLVLERGATAADDTQQRGLTRALSRIRTISRIHEQFYHGDDLSSVDLADYLGGLASEIVSSYGSERGIRVETRLDAVQLDFDRTIPLGLLLHELLTMSCEHDFPVSEPPVVTVGLAHADTGVTLTVRDNGVGAGSLGGEGADDLAPLIVRALIDQVGGTIAEVDRGISILIPSVLTTPTKAK
jgi:two-component sensor histidine kinase